MGISELAADLIAVKEVEAVAKKMRLAAEERLLAALSGAKTEGTVTHRTAYYKIAVIYKVTRHLDFDKYMALDLPGNLQFVDMCPTINLARLRHIEAVDPGLVASCVTIKPAKASIKVEGVA